jgi:hypothetical protein
VKKNIHFALIVDTATDAILEVKVRKGSQEMTGRTLETILVVVLNSYWLTALFSSVSFLRLDITMHKMHHW